MKRNRLYLPLNDAKVIASTLQDDDDDDYNCSKKRKRSTCGCLRGHRADQRKKLVRNNAKNSKRNHSKKNCPKEFVGHLRDFLGSSSKISSSDYSRTSSDFFENFSDFLEIFLDFHDNSQDIVQTSSGVVPSFPRFITLSTRSIGDRNKKKKSIVVDTKLEKIKIFILLQLKKI